MATSADVRDWARADGQTVTGRGRVPARLIAGWNAAHPDDLYVADARDSAGAPDYPDDDESVFADEPGTGETAPRRPPRGRRSQGRGFFGFGKPKGRKGKTVPRVSTEDMLGAVWRGLAGMARPLPPLHRTLRIQAPVAGAVLDDAVRDTVVDPLLQPLARLAGAGKALNALVGPPLYVTVMSVHADTMAAQQQPPNPLVMSVAREGLRSSLMAWLDIAGPKFEAAMKREKEFESRYGSSVDQLIDFLFSPPPEDAADVEAEEAAIRRAQGLRDDDSPGMV